MNGSLAVDSTLTAGPSPAKKQRVQTPLVIPREYSTDFIDDRDEYLKMYNALLRLGYKCDSDDYAGIMACYHPPLFLTSECPVEIPEAIGNLAGLPALNFTLDLRTNIESLPHSIGRWQNLQTLNLSHTLSLSRLPEEIGNLTCLKTLDLRRSAIASIPTSIGQLQNLEFLYASETRNLSTMPEEIGQLASLKELRLVDSKVISLPATIGHLQNLQLLDISETNKLSAVPEDVGNLVSLKTFKMGFSNVTSIPESIWNLQSLEHLGWDFKVVTFLNNDSVIQSWFNSIQRLKRLRIIRLSNVPGCKLKKDNLFPFLFGMAQRCQSLGHIFKCESLRLCLSNWAEETKLGYALACNRARSRIGFRTADGSSLSEIPALWPLLLQRATATFIKYPERNLGAFCYGEVCKIKKPDALHWLLVAGRESFVCALIDRNRRSGAVKS